MAVKARASITLTSVVDVSAVYRYYLLQSATLAAPAKPTANPPGGSWTLSEPSYASGGTNSLYTTDLTVFSDNTFLYSTVCLSSGYEAAKAAYNKAASAESAAAEARAGLDALDSHLGAVENSVGELSHTMSLDYVARSDFGSYTEQIAAQIEANARAITESYQYAELVSAAAAAGIRGELTQYMTAVDGQIRRGYITDPDTNDTVIGIAISQKLQFTGSTQTVDGETCYELDGAQTFGLYTSTGWQFWVGGRKIGWFSSADGKLHVRTLAVENGLELGAGWLLTVSGGFGLRYTGG